MNDSDYDWLYTREELIAKAKEIRETEDEGWTAFRAIVALIMAVKE